MDNYDINKQIDNVIKNLNTILSESNLPIGVAYYLIKDVYNNVEYQYIQYLNNYNKEHAEKHEVTFFEEPPLDENDS